MLPDLTRGAPATATARPGGTADRSRSAAMERRPASPASPSGSNLTGASPTRAPRSPPEPTAPATPMTAVPGGAPAWMGNALGGHDAVHFDGASYLHVAIHRRCSGARRLHRRDRSPATSIHPTTTPRLRLRDLLRQGAQQLAIRRCPRCSGTRTTCARLRQPAAEQTGLVAQVQSCGSVARLARRSRTTALARPGHAPPQGRRDDRLGAHRRRRRASRARSPTSTSAQARSPPRSGAGVGASSCSATSQVVASPRQRRSGGAHHLEAYLKHKYGL